MAYPLVNISSPVEVAPARGAVIAQKFQILQVIENFHERWVRVRFEIQEADGTSISQHQDFAWAGESYDAVSPWNDDALIQRVQEMVQTRLARFTAA